MPENPFAEKASPRKPETYDNWTGNPKGMPEDPTRCIKGVSDYTGWHLLQCSRKRGFGPDGLYCKQHAKQIEERMKK